MRNAVLGSWARTGVVAAILVLILGSIAALGATGRLGDLRYLNIPLLHPWPPAGYYQNPFNPTDRGDLVNSAEAAKVNATPTIFFHMNATPQRIGEVDW